MLSFLILLLSSSFQRPIKIMPSILVTALSWASLSIAATLPRQDLVSRNVSGTGFVQLPMTRVEKQGGPVSRRQEYDAPLFNPDFGNDYFVHCMKLSTSHWTIFNRHQWILELLLNQSIFLSIPDPQRLGVIQHVQLPPPPSKWHNATAIQDMIHITPTLLLTKITHSISPMAKDQLPEST
jgi:hypothetical protein